MSLNKSQIQLLTRIHNKSSRARPLVDNLISAFKAGGCAVEVNGNAHSFSYDNTTLNYVTFSQDKTPPLGSLDKKFAAIATSILCNEVEDFRPEYSKGRKEPRGLVAPIYG